jgi:hypothetical protein
MTPDDAQRPTIVVGVVDLASLVVAIVIGADDRAADPSGEGGEVIGAGRSSGAIRARAIVRFLSVEKMRGRGVGAALMLFPTVGARCGQGSAAAAGRMSMRMRRMTTPCSGSGAGS